MDLTKIISISGMPGLFKVVGAMKQGAVVESLSDGKRFPTYPSHKVSSLADISIFTTGESVPLPEVLKKIYEKEEGKETPELKPDSDEMKKYFESVLPDYDKEKVHNSDMKKLINWYNVLLKKDLLKPEEIKEEEEGQLSSEKLNDESEEGKKEKTEDALAAISNVEKNPVKKPEIHKPIIQTPKPAAGAPRKNINVRRKTG